MNKFLILDYTIDKYEIVIVASQFATLEIVTLQNGNSKQSRLPMRSQVFDAIGTVWAALAFFNW